MMKRQVIPAGYIRDMLHNLDPVNEKHLELYKIARYHYFVQSEGREQWAYDDKTSRKINSIMKPKGKVTIGIGFNMDAAGARMTWDKLFEGNIAFDDVYQGKRKITWDQVDRLFEYCLDIRERELRNIYGQIFDNLRLNERLAIEDLYYNKPKLARRGSEVYEYIKGYYNDGNEKHLRRAVYQVKNLSNERNEVGLQNRRNGQAKLLSSFDCPFYSKPNDPWLPFKAMEAIVADSVIPRGTENWPKNSDSKYYIWRTVGDGKVRVAHFLLEGKIFSEEFKPIVGHPGSEYNCRCIRESLPMNIQVIEESMVEREKKYCNLNLDLFGLELFYLKKEVECLSAH